MSNAVHKNSRSQGMTVLLLALLLGLQPITTDLYLPTLPTLTQGFGASMVQAQLTLTALLLAFGTSQLFWGPLSDMWGRRPVLLGGVAVYAAAAVACALSPSIETLIAARTLQGIAMGGLKTRGVDKNELGLPGGADAGDAVSGGLRFARGDADFLTHQGIEQGGLAHIGLTHNGHQATALTGQAHGRIQGCATGVSLFSAG